MIFERYASCVPFFFAFTLFVIFPPSKIKHNQMSADFSMALQLLGIGMGTVFLILSFVVVSGNALIRIVNRYMPETVRPKAESPTPAITAEHMAVLTAAVEMLTEGKGKITSIEKK